MNILFVGDIFGQPGRVAVGKIIPLLKKKHKIDFVIVNGENAAGGIGITADTARELFDYGVDVITTGNHIWKQKDIIEYIKSEPNLVRPLNFPPETPGKGSVVIEKKGLKVGVINILGRIFMSEIDCPFRVAAEEIKNISKQTPIIIVDIHAEATSEKKAIGWFFDGLVSAVVGTHTHVQTADERILPSGTAYISDVGMTGSMDSVIGIKREIAIRRFLTQLPIKFEVAQDNVQMNAVLLSINKKGKANSIKRIQVGLGKK